MSLENSVKAALEAGGHFATLGTAADHAAALSNISGLPLPAAYIIFGDYEDAPNIHIGQIVQQRTETIIVRYAVGNAAEALGGSAMDEARSADDAIRAALHGLEVDGYEPMETSGGALIGYDRGTLWRDAFFIARTYYYATPHS
jgi:hypothetical protein